MNIVAATGQGGYLVPTDPGAGPASRADWACIVCNKAQPHSFVDAVVQVGVTTTHKGICKLLLVSFFHL